MTLRERAVTSSGLSLHVVEDGPEQGFPVVFVHGFPEFWWSWRHQIEAVAGAGYRAVAYDQRGFGDSDKPADVSAYALPNALADLSAVIDSVGGRAAVVCHDWGGVVGWLAGAFLQDKVERLAVLNAPHPGVRRDLAYLPQLQKSWYMLFFQFEGVAEDVLSRDDFRLFRAWFYDTASLPLSEQEVARYIEVFSRPGALTAGLNWYRANVPPQSWFSDGGGAGPGLPAIRCPVLLLWGLDDAYLDFEIGRRAGEHCEGPFALQALQDTGHWIQQERPDEVNRHLLAFLEVPAEPAQED